MEVVSTSVGKFTVDLFNKLNETNKGKNIFFSPWSISAALGLTYLGAKGTTATEMAETYIQLSKNYYKAEPQKVNFKTAPEQSGKEINTWVEKQTEGKIKNLLGPRDVTNSTKLILINAIYFKAEWEVKFKAEDTEVQPFRLSKNKTKPVKMMYVRKTFPVLIMEAMNFKMIELPYVKRELSMFILLPDDIKDNTTGLEQLERELTYEKLSEWTDSKKMTETLVDLYLPKFKMEERYDLSDNLIKMGMRSAFSINADFSGMTEKDKVMISKVFHKSFVAVDEKGVPMESLSVSTNSFTLDLYKKLNETSKGQNIFFSPWSIATALAMVHLGAKGDTATQMAEVLHFNQSAREEGSSETRKPSPARPKKRKMDPEHEGAENIHSGFKKLLSDINKRRSTYLLKSANRLYEEKTYPLLPTKTKPVQMMFLKDKFFTLHETTMKIRIIELPYVENELSMFILLPDDISDNTTGLELVEREMTYEKLAEWTKSTNMMKAEVDLYLPKLKVEENYDLQSPLRSMGIRNAFDPAQADFTGMSVKKDLFISQVIHKAFVEVNEEGREIRTCDYATPELITCTSTGVVVLVQVLSLKNAQDAHNGYQSLLSEINDPNTKYILRTANRLYGEKTFEFLAVKSRTCWTEGILNSLTRLVLVNAIYFKGNWEEQFNKQSTRESPFQINKNESRPVQMMFKEENFNMTYIGDFQTKILELPYVGNELSMIILLPDAIRDESTGLERLESELTYEKLIDWINPEMMDSTKVRVSLPRFKLEEDYDLKGLLSSMGMPDAFDSGKADFSGISSGNELVLSEVIHKSFVEVNEEGTEAAAATAAMMMMRCSMRVPEFTADHPFLFFIRHNKTSSILFCGRFCHP
ncbi:hypothetical protein DUI87_08272 [Hirundo rustica rustica]|uniref:Serpin B6 n=1 Tax=Hirundo rustica rustica TaxID=333673 RepID=A0A3M0KSC7_HIRRU|nr:hypothetical protein DUI87_08272 [Hirundo rustica rustica]